VKRRVNPVESVAAHLLLLLAVASAIPLYVLLNTLGLLNSRTVLVVCYAATSVPFAIFQLRAAFEAIPVDLEEAAMVDGATRFQTFLRVALPAARPAIAVTSLFAFMSAYNEFILAATLLGREDMFTLPVVLQRYIGEFNANWPAFAAGAPDSPRHRQHKASGLAAVAVPVVVAAPPTLQPDPESPIG
jgi:ABC-type maltose transport system permease subunit